MLLRRHVWRWPPKIWAVAVVAAVTVLGIVIAEGLGSSEDAVQHKETRSQRSPSPPGDSSAPGQIEDGDIFRARVAGSSAFEDPAQVPVGRTVVFGFRLSNPGPGELAGVRLRVRLPKEASTSAAVSGIAASSSGSPSTTRDDATVNYAQDHSACLQFVPGSAVLRNAAGGFVRRLPDGVTQGGINVGRVGIRVTQIRYVRLRALANAAPIASRCPNA
jgi:hypothetical protein